MTYICREWFRSYHDAFVEDEMRAENSEEGLHERPFNVLSVNGM